MRSDVVLFALLDHRLLLALALARAGAGPLEDLGRPGCVAHQSMRNSGGGIIRLNAPSADATAGPNPADTDARYLLSAKFPAGNSS